MKRLICVVGPTASGKSALALRLARHFCTALVSADARQVYRHLDIGTAKPSAEERAEVPHYLIDILDPDQPYSAGQFVRDAEALLPALFAEHDTLLMAGGSTLYVEALWQGMNELPPVPLDLREALRAEWRAAGLPPLLAELRAADPETYEAIDRQNPARVLRALELIRASGQPASRLRQGRSAPQYPWQTLKIGIAPERKALYARIDRRVEEMAAAGLADEVRRVLKMGYAPDLQSLQSIGYSEMIAWLQGLCTWEQALGDIQRNTRNYARRQLTWWRRHTDIRWFPSAEAAFGALAGDDGRR